MKNSPILQELPPSRKVLWMITSCLISGLIILQVYKGKFVFGSEAGNWLYRYFDQIIRVPFWIFFSVTLLLGVLVFLGGKTIHRHEITTLVVALLIAIAMQIILNLIYPVSISLIVRSDKANSFYSPAMNHTPIEILSGFQALAPTFPVHAISNMPGKILFYQFLMLFTASPRGMGYLIISISSLGGWLMYAICKMMFKDKSIAFISFVLYILLPCKLYFFPILNTVTPVFILLCMCLLLLYIEYKHRIFLFLLGAAIYALILFEPTPLATGFIFVGLLVHAIYTQRITFKELLLVICLPILSFGVVFLLFKFIYSFDLWHAFQYTLVDALEFNSRTERGYWIWIVENLKEFSWGMGLPVMMAFIYNAAAGINQWKRYGVKCILHSLDSIYVFSLLITIMVISFLGINRGETTRLWIYLAVFFQIPASIYLGKKINSQLVFFIFAATIMAQLFIGLQRVGFVLP